MKILAGAASIMLAAVPAAEAASSNKPTIVLVHGAFETGDAWDLVIPKLERDGYVVKKVNLPGRTGNEMPMNEVTLALYQKTVSEAIASETSPVVLVGHSFGGFTISAEAEAEPEKIKTLVYVAAYIPKSGDSLLSMATADKGSRLAPILSVDKEKGFASVAHATGGALFGSDASKSVQSVIAGGIVNEPLAPLATPVTLSAERFGKVDKVAIRTLRDEVVSTPFQVAMETATSVRLQLTINTGHAPFITEPGKLAIAIEKAAR